MYKIGSIPPRSLKSFGVAGLLSAEASVFYESIFSSKHIGRISDLLAARLKKSGIDELRLRSSIVFTAFEAIRGQLVSGESELLKEPLVIECGIDGEKLAVGAAFVYGSNELPDLNQVENRLNQGEIQSDFDLILLELRSLCDQILIRIQPQSHRIEVIAMNALDSSQNKKVSLFEVLEIEQEESALQPKEFVQLGDLDYPELLKDESPLAKPVGKGAGEILSERAQADVTKTIVGGEKEAQELKTAIEEKYGTQSSNTVVKGVTDVRKDETTQLSGSDREKDKNTVIKGTTQRIEADNTKFVVSGGQNPVSLRDAASTRETEQLLAKIANLEAQLKTKESRSNAEIVKGKFSTDLDEKQVFHEEELTVAAEKKEKRRKINVVEPDDDTADSDSSDTLIVKGSKKKKSTRNEDMLRDESLDDSVEEEEEEEGEEYEDDDSEDNWESEDTGVTETVKRGWDKIKSVFLFGKKRKKSRSFSHEETESEIDDAESQDITPTQVIDEIQEPVKKKEEESGDVDVERVAKSLVVEIEAGSLDRALVKAKKEMTGFGRDAGSVKAKQWAEGLMVDLISEKGKLYDVAKKLNASVRRKEIEFKNQKRGLEEELKRRDELVKQRDTAIMRLKDQLAQMNINMERVKSSAQDAVADAHFKTKFSHIQKLYGSAKNENAELVKTIERLQRQLSQAKATTSGDPGLQDEIGKMSRKNELLQRQLEEFKRNNASLMDRLREADKKRTTNMQKFQDIRQRLEQAMRIAVDSKKESEKALLELRAAEAEKIRMGRDLEEARNTIKIFEARGAQSAEKKVS